MNEPKTPNLGLNKIDRSSPSTTYFDLDKYLDQNWEKIDEGVGQVVEKAEETAAQVSSIQERLDTEKRRSVTLEPGLQIINAERASAFKLEGLKGRTLVNLLGRDGNFESAARWLLFQGAASIDPANKTEGSNGIKLTVTSGAFATATAVNTINAKANKFYIAVVDAKNGNATNASFYCNGLTATKGVNVTSDTTKFVPLWRAYAPTSDVVGSVIIQTNSSATGQYAYFDAVRFYEITADEYAALDSMTPEQVNAKYPYVDSVQPVRNPYAIRYGENLLPPFYEWLVNDGVNAMVEGPYTLTGTATAANQPTDSPLISVPVGTTLTISGGGNFENGYMQIINKSKTAPIANNAGAVYASFTATEETREFYVRVQVQGAGAYKIENPMLNIGSTPKPFKPREDTILTMQTDLFADPVTGENADEVFEKDGRYFKLAKWSTFDDFKSLNWVMNDSASGVKRVRVDNLSFNWIDHDKSSMTKYDGKVMKVGQSTAGAGSYTFEADAGRQLFVVVSNSDSGWGDSYNPTADEIKAYFMGWTMFNGAAGTGVGNSPDVPTNNVYNGTGIKWWARRSDGVVRSWADATNILPTTQAPNWTPYQLIYQLTTATVEPITSEGQFTFIEGNNHIEVGTGLVLREGAKAISDGANYFINSNTLGSQLKYRTAKILALYSSGRVVNNAEFQANANAYGLYQIKIPPQYLKQSEPYSVTYLMLDTSPVAAFVGTVSENEKALLTDLVQDVQQATARISVVESKKAEKDSPAWITPTLLNGWSQYSSGYPSVQYTKDSIEYVHVRGLIKGSGTDAGTRLFILPAGYRPKTRRIFNVLSFNAAPVATTVEVTEDGAVYLGSTAASLWLNLEGVSFNINI